MLDLVELANETFDSRMEDFETAIPGVVERVNDDGTVDARPSIRNVLKNMQLEPADPKTGRLRPAKGVPVLWPGTATAVAKFELAEGDPVLLVASSRDLRTWKEGGWDSGKPYSPPSFAGNDMNSLLAVPLRLERHGKSSPKTVVTVKRDGSVRVECGKIEIDAESVKISGELEVGKGVKAGGEVTANADTLPVNLSTHTHMTAVGPSDPGKG